ncbi:MAG: dihydroorotase [Ruminococcaceae bacterium]|nr:dihydroorotase [Oscillospiraceae bacterium]
MRFTFKNAYVYGVAEKTDVVIDTSAKNVTNVSVFSDNFSGNFSPVGEEFSVSKKCVIFPGFVDVHVHLREPGFSYKETVKSGSEAAAAGGYVAVCSMPNLNPSPYSAENLKAQTDIIDRDAVIKVIPYGRITRDGQTLSDMEEMARSVVAFSDDGVGVQTASVMRKAMIEAKRLGKIIAAHCEDDALRNGGAIHDGKYAKEHNIAGISSESEWKQIERDIDLVRETLCAYHVCHISTKEGVDLIRRAKAEGLNVSCETGPHYLVMDENDLIDHGNFKMNPPLRSSEDREALIEGIRDGTIDMIATDHAPHSEEEKSKGLAGSLMGIVGLETAFPVLYTELVRKGVISLEKLVELLSEAPAKRFDIDTGEMLGEKASFTVFEIEDEYEINPEDFKSMGKNTPFGGKKVFGKCLMTVYDGKIVHNAL